MISTTDSELKKVPIDRKTKSFQPRKKNLGVETIFQESAPEISDNPFQKLFMAN